MRVFAILKKALFFAPVLRVPPKIHAGFRQKGGLRMVAEGLFGSFWVVLGRFGSFLGRFGSFWVILGRFGVFWGLLDPYLTLYGLETLKSTLKTAP
jgi:hypothetical protein